jgi:6-phosphogluconolactonase (cycloisomerase 2 family)
MKRRVLASTFLAVGAAVLATSPAAFAGGGHAVFVQTNELAGNQIVVYDRGHDGTLTQAGTYATGGDGGAAAPGAESDRLASQSSLFYDDEHSLLLAVNAGSDTISAFSVHGDRLTLEDVVSSGGQFPASIAVSHDIVYVLNGGGEESVQGFRIHGHDLQAIAGSNRSLGVTNTDPPFFLTSPGQVGFTPDGRQLIVTTKANGSTIDVFQVEHGGLLSATPVANPSAQPVPFAFTFGPHDRLVDGEAGTSSVTTYGVGDDGTLTDPKSQSDGQAALCWIVRAHDVYFVSNTASNTISSFAVGHDGQPTLLQAVAATTDAGPIDLATSGRFLYAEAGLAGAVDEFAIGHDGSLTQIGTVTGLPPGLEGIAAS